MKINQYSAVLLLSSLLLIANEVVAQPYPSQNISLYAKWDTVATVSIPPYGVRYNSIWGWVDPQDNREYAILGATEGTYFIEVTDPANPAVRDFVPGRRDSCTWREYKTYLNYAYLVSDDNLPNSFQIVDLSPLPDSVNIVHDDDSIIVRAHALFVDGDKLYLAIPKSYSFGVSVMAVYSLANPILPLLLRKLDDDFPSSDYVHDMFARNDTVYASSSYSGLYVYKYNSGANQFSMLGSITSYFDQGYNHSSSLTADGKTLVMMDEVPDTLSVKIVDVSDLTNITVVYNYNSHNKATPHNPYIIGNRWAVLAYYQDGVYILDISDPPNPSLAGFFDTHPQNGDNNGYPYPPYQGCWGAYVDLPSGIIIASDMQNGLFILDADSAITVQESGAATFSVEVHNNPAGRKFFLELSLPHKQWVKFSLTDLSGKLILLEETFFGKGKTRIPVHAIKFQSGVYLIKVEGEEGTIVKKIIKL